MIFTFFFFGPATPFLFRGRGGVKRFLQLLLGILIHFLSPSSRCVETIFDRSQKGEIESLTKTNKFGDSLRLMTLWRWYNGSTEIVSSAIQTEQFCQEIQNFGLKLILQPFTS